MRKAIKILGLAGLVALGGLTASAVEKFKHPYGDKITLNAHPTFFSLEYDTDNNGTGDLRMFYKILKVPAPYNIKAELVRVLKDINNDGKYEENETIYRNLKHYPKIKGKNI